MNLTCVTAVRNAVADGRRAELIRCIESVAKLETPHEHLVYDGASTDGTVELLRELETKTPGLKACSEPDTGIYNALNKGVRDAKGEWFYVLGCDDQIVAPAVFDSLITTVPSDTRLIVAPVQTGTTLRQIPDRHHLKGLFTRTPHCHQGLIMRTADLRMLGGFNEQYKICADYDIMLKLHGLAVPTFYSFTPFADYSLSGTSEREPDLRKFETARCVRHFLGLSEGQDFGDRRAPPVHVMMKFIFHKDLAIRLSARSMIAKRIKNYIRFVLFPLVLATRPIRTRHAKRNRLANPQT